MFVKPRNLSISYRINYRRKKLKSIANSKFAQTFIRYFLIFEEKFLGTFSQLDLTNDNKRLGFSRKNY